MDINKSIVIQDGRLGNGLAAASDLGAGEAIIEIANPYILVVEQASLPKVCSYCLVEDQHLSNCKDCKAAWYCSKTCQRAGWKSIHKLECKILSTMVRIPPTPTRALMQVLLSSSPGASTTPNSRWAGLESHQTVFAKTPRWDDMVMQTTAALYYSKRPAGEPIWKDFALGILCRMETNAFRATSASDEPVGLCFEPVLALANHSCAPNSAIVFDGRKIMLRSLYPIKRGEQISISYIDNTQPRAARQAELRERYFFGCECQKCTENDNPYSSWLRHPHDSSKHIYDRLSDPHRLEIEARSLTSAYANNARNLSPPNIYAHVQKQLDDVRRTPDCSTRLRVLTDAVGVCSGFRSIGRYADSPFPAIVHELYLLYLDSESYSSALILLLFLHLHCYAFTYPQPHHPSNVVRLLAISNLCKAMPGFLEQKGALSKELLIPGGKAVKMFSNVDWISASQCLLIEIVELAALSHGKETRFMKLVQAELADVEEAQQMRGNGNMGQKLKRWSETRGYESEDGLKGLTHANAIFQWLKRLGGQESAHEVMDWGLTATSAQMAALTPKTLDRE